MKPTEVDEGTQSSGESRFSIVGERRYMRYSSLMGFVAISALLFSPIVYAVEDWNWNGTWEIYTALKGSNGPKMELQLKMVYNQNVGLFNKVRGTYPGGSIDGIISRAYNYGFAGTWSGSPSLPGLYSCTKNSGDFQLDVGQNRTYPIEGHWTCGDNPQGHSIIGRRASEQTPTQPNGTNKPEEGPCANACDKSKHLVWDGYAGCNCICESGWKFDEHGNCELEEVLEMEAELWEELDPSGAIKTIKPGDTITVPMGEKAKLLLVCKDIQNQLAFLDLAPMDPFKSNFGRFHLIVSSESIRAKCAELGIPLEMKGLAEAQLNASGALVSAFASNLPVQLTLDLQQGPLRVEVVNDKVLLNIDTPTGTVSSSGKNVFVVAYDPKNGSSYVAAYQKPVRIQPANSNLAPFTLNAGQQVEVSAEKVGPVASLGQANNTAPGTAATGAGNATAGNATGGIAPGSPTMPGASGPGAATGGVLSPSGNNQIGDSALVGAAQSISQTINPAGSSNFYSFHVDTPGILELRLENVPKDMRPFVSLHDKNLGSIAERSASNAGDTVRLEKDILGPGWLYIEVRDLDGKAHSEAYSLEISFLAAPDQYEPNPNLFRATIIQPDQTLNAYICPINDEDYFKVYVDTSGIFKLKMDAVPEDMKPELSLRDKTASQIAYAVASNPGDKISLEKDVQGPGWFYAGVRDLESKAHSDPYTLKISFQPATDQLEPNPNFFRATELMPGQSVTAYICPTNDEDFYKLQVGSQGVVKIALDSVPAEMKSEVSLYDKTWTQIAYIAALNPGDKVSLEKDVQGPGWYYIKVRDPTGKAFSEPYTLTAAL